MRHTPMQYFGVYTIVQTFHPCCFLAINLVFSISADKRPYPQSCFRVRFDPFHQFCQFEQFPSGFALKFACNPAFYLACDMCRTSLQNRPWTYHSHGFKYICCTVACYTPDLYAETDYIAQILFQFPKPYEFVSVRNKCSTNGKIAAKRLTIITSVSCSFPLLITSKTPKFGHRL